MELQEIFDRIIFRSGQYILKKKNLEVNVDSFRFLIDDALAIYNKACPFIKEYQQRVDFPRHFDFTATYDQELGRVPDWLSEVTPVNFVSGSPFGGRNEYNIASHPSYGNPELIDPIQAPWIYTKPRLTVERSANYAITAVFNHKCENSGRFTDTGDSIYHVKTITTEDNLFFDLLQGMFMIGIGRSRSAFTHSDLPILIKGDELVSDGKDMVALAKEELKTRQMFRLSMG